LGAVISENAGGAQQLTASAQQQTTGMEQITLAMQNINQATVQSLASTRQAEFDGGVGPPPGDLTSALATNRSGRRLG
jgi:hypothetical protein